jgi:hypothetical protein
MNLSEEEDTFFDALQDHLDLDVTGVIQILWKP